ncbi:MAG: hypothetical protein HQM09_17295 [Candidatus Riflebacteria bacterium]|nr:hypothetical protein [Candidatus Riflebacteria bacterium]
MLPSFGDFPGRHWSSDRSNTVCSRWNKFAEDWKKAQGMNKLIAANLVVPRGGYRACPKKNADGTYSFVFQPAKIR